MTDTTHGQTIHDSGDVLTDAWSRDPGIWGWFTVVNHKAIGRRFIVTGLIFFLVGGVLALLIRTQLAIPENSFLSAELYNQIFTMHGTTMMFLFAVPILEGVAIYLMPLMLGTRDLPFPRLNAFGYWAYLFGGIFVFSSFLIGQAPQEGWFAYVPLASSTFAPHMGMDFWLLGVTMVEISGIVGGLELVVGFFRRRSHGMSLNRVPLFAWASMVTGAMIITAFPAIVTASSLLELERVTGLVFYDPSGGGDPLLWQHLFWFFGHPEVYIMLLPAVGMLAMIIPVFSRRTHAGYGWVVAAFIGIGIASFGLWVHHMFTTGLPSVALAFFSAASVLIAVPSGVLVFSWLATMWGGRPRFQTPLLFVVGFLVVFVIGGITGVMVASVPFNTQVHDSFFVVAHFHYVLLGGVVFPLFAGLYYWFPKWTGRLTSEARGKSAFWTMFVGVNLAFFPQHFLGFQGMPRRVFTYQVGLGWELGNMLSTIGAFVFAAGVLMAVFDFVVSRRNGPTAGADPWEANSLEWATTSPPPVYNFRQLPVVGSADPLWDDAPPPEDSTEGWMPRLMEPAEPVREVVDTSPVEGTAQAIVRLPGASPWPIAVALSLTAALLGVLGSWYFLTVVGATVMVAAVVAWGAADPQSRLSEPILPAAEEGPVRSFAGMWGLTVALVSISVILGSLVFGYWQLTSSAESWPPPANGPIGWLLPLLAAGVAVATVAAIWGASRTNDEDRPAPTLVLVGVAAVLAFGFAALALGSLADGLGRIQGSAYGSVVAVLFGFVALLSVGLGFGLVSVIARVADRYPAGAVAFQACRVYGSYVVVAWLVVIAVVLFGQTAVGA